ncbi:FG-GAP-like repeat-containing protein [Thermomonas carbonis]|uniref:FG-GAP repeat protein n=1 Tax=Thermomonas carbonis TaxID=1463158 RepID=A0A7G9SU86_9GAMM|nr:FG-GAP-like repeat-containing protein [Thermomonas carbonis]QNN71411.1 FG-GAP repeat protein [Thermomonas carbonis]
MRQQVALGELWSDRVQDISVGSVPSLVMTGARILEGGAGQSLTVNLNLYLSTPAPPGGAAVDVDVVSGTAMAGSDFVAAVKRRVTIGAGSNSITVPVVINGDAMPEATEWFKVVLSNPSGGWLPSPEATIYIENDDFGLLRNDFDGDGRSDVFWRNLTDGRNILWWAADYNDQFNPGAVASQSWAVVGAGDFDGDGKSDLFWRNSANGQNIIWPSADGNQKRNVTAITGLDWKVVATGDFDGDGHADIFWRHATNGQNAIWWSGDYAARTMEQAVSTTWKVAGSGDFDGDGKEDVFWRNTSTGANVVWWSGDYAGYTNLTGVTNQAWAVVAIGDYAGDGVADAFWRNQTTGEHIIWWNGSYANQVRETTVSTAWKLVASGDYNGDGESDLFWRNGATGANIIWDSGRYASRRNVTGVTNAAWVIQQ